MQTHLIDILKVKFQDTLVKHKYQNSSIKKINQGYQNRVFDGCELWSTGILQLFCQEFKLITDNIKKIAENDTAYKRISQQDDEIFSYLEDLLNNNDMIQRRLVKLVENISLLGCKDLLDGYGHIKTEFIDLFNWNIFTTTPVILKHKEIILSYCFVMICECSFISTKDDLHSRSAKAEIINNAINKWFNVNLDKYIKRSLDKTQQYELYDNYVDECILTLSKYNEMILKNPSIIEVVMKDDLMLGQNNSNLHKQKLIFWIKIIYECGVVYKQHELFLILLTVFKSNNKLTDNDMKDFDIVSDLRLLDAHKKDKYHKCLKLATQLQDLESIKNDIVDEKITTKSKVIKEGFETILQERDKEIILDSILRDYLSTPLKQRHSAEIELLGSVIRMCEDKDKIRLPIHEILYQLSNKSLHYSSSCLAKIINSYIQCISPSNMVNQFFKLPEKVLSSTHNDCTKTTGLQHKAVKL